MTAILGASPRGRHPVARVPDSDVEQNPIQLSVIWSAKATKMAMPQSNDRKMSMRVLMVNSLEPGFQDS